MEWLVNLWATIEPYATDFIQWLVTTGTGVLASILAVRKFFKKNENTSEVTAQAVVDKIANTDVKLSLESVNRTQLEKIKNQILSTVSSSFEDISLQNQMMIAMARIMLKFKATTEEEREQLVSAINLIEDKYHSKKTTIEDSKTEVVTVKIEPVETEKVDLF